jgi:hypothetical protein
MRTRLAFWVVAFTAVWLGAISPATAAKTTLLDAAEAGDRAPTRTRLGRTGLRPSCMPPPMKIWIWCVR